MHPVSLLREISSPVFLRLILWGSLLFFLIGFVASATGQNVVRIAAIVNDEIISVFDLGNRVRLVAATTNVPNRQDMLQRLAPQVLRTMIDERIQLQEAKRLSIRVSQREINGTIAGLERQNGMAPGQISVFLQQNNIDRSALESQITARISWLKLINRTLMRQISIGREEVEEELERLRALKGKPQMRVSEIFLGIDSPDLEPQIRQTAERLIAQLLNGARFDALAREFSQSTTSGSGGDLGWITSAELDPELIDALSVMQPGQISRPVRTLTGYHILYLSDRRTLSDMTPNPDDTAVEYRQLLLPLLSDAPTSEIETQRQLAQEITDTASSCDDFVLKGRAVGAHDMERLNVVTVGALNGQIRDILMTQKLGTASQPQRTQDGYVVIMPCSRTLPEVGLPTPEALEERIRQSRLDMMAQRYMRDLRRAAYIDLRQ